MTDHPLDAAGLRTVRAIADTGSISAAARRLGYSQPAISQQVRRLEHRLGTPVLERSGRSVRLTEAGQVLARHAVTVDAAIDAATAEVAAIAGLRAGRVRLVAFPSSSATLVPRALALLRVRHPGVEVWFAEAEPPESLAQLRDGECDLAVAFSYAGRDDDTNGGSTSGAIGRGEDDLSGLVTRHLLEDPLVLALPASHLLAGRDVVHLADLHAQTWIAGCPRCRGHLIEVCAAAGFSPGVAYATDDYVAVLGLVAAGLGVALIPALVLDTARHHEVVLREVSPASTRAVQAVTTPDLLRVPAVRATLDALTEVAADR